MSDQNKQVLLVSRPAGEATEQNFRLTMTPVPSPGPGQVLVRNHYLSLDPYMRGRMNETKSYMPPHPLNQVMLGATAGEVVESKHERFSAGDKVVAFGGWQDYSVVDGGAPTIRKVDTSVVPLSAYLGAAGMPGVTAWYGLNKICHPSQGITLVVSAASGAVGSAVGQLAKLAGCNVVGIAGGPDKCAYVVKELGFDACVDYKAFPSHEALYSELAAATPQGVDAYFENVGGAVLDATLARMNAFGRIALCGMISGYEGEPIPLRQPSLILGSRLTVTGFIIGEHPDVWPEALAELIPLVASKKIKYRETVAEGLEAAPSALLGLLKGRNFGKQVVRLVRTAN